MAGVISIIGEAQINTGMMMKNLILKAQSLNVQVFNRVNVQDLQSNGNHVAVQTDSGAFVARKCIVATNGFAQRLIPTLDVKPARAQVLVTKPIPNLKFKGTYHFDQGYYYFRNVGDRVLFGGGRNLDFDKETTYDLALTDHIQNHLTHLLQERILPDTPFEIEHRWSGIMGTGRSRKIILEAYGSAIAVAVRMGGMGVVIGSLIGKRAAEMIE